MEKATDEAKENRESLSFIHGFVDRMSSQGMPHSDVTWVAHDMGSYAGVYRPLECFLARGNAPDHNLRPLLIDLSAKDRTAVDSMIDWSVGQSNKVVLNSISSFSDSRVERLIGGASAVAIYLHETAWTIERYRQKDPVGYDRFLKCIKNATVFCVSDRQAEYVRSSFGPKETKVVYNSVNTMLSPNARKMGIATRSLRESREKTVRVGMVGSYQSRKGTALFADVARLASGADIQFEWVGKYHEGALHKDVVNFLGPKNREQTQKFIAGLDVMFIPSQDDPQPLAALEAASRGVKIICYAGIGTADWIRNIKGCSVFETYDAEAALASLHRVLAEPLDDAALDKALRDHFDEDVFTQTLKTAIDEMDAKAGSRQKTEDRPSLLARALARFDIQRLPRAANQRDWTDLAQALKVLKRDLSAVQRYQEVAQILVEMGEIDLADQVHLAAIENNPTKPSARREAAKHFFETGRVAQAHELADEAVRMNPESKSAVQLLQRIGWSSGRSA